MHSRVHWKRISALIVLFVSLFATPSAMAQIAGGTISGVVKDQQDAVVPGAKISLIHADTGVERLVSTNGQGTYSAPNLAPGLYQLNAEAEGFTAIARKDVSLKIGSEMVIDFAMTIGTIAETVEVHEESAAVDLVTSTVQRNVGGEAIRQLPLNGRSWSDLATLQPGIASIGKGGAGGKGGNGVKLTVAGARPSENNFRQDGISLNDNSNSTPGSILGTNLGVEAIGEFSVVANNYSAEYGRATGGVINAITKSGTNELHGGLFYFHRNSPMDARNFFDRQKPAFRRHQFGGTAGGPIVNNQTFWFTNYEAVREFLSSTSIANTLSAAARTGQLAAGSVSVDPEIARVFPLMPLPNGPLLGNGDTGLYIGAIDKVSTGNYALGKVDHRLSDAISMNGSYFFDGAKSASPDTFRTRLTEETSRRQVATMEATTIFSPYLLSVTRFGFSRNAVPGSLIGDVYNPLLTDPSLGFVPGKNVGTITVPGITVTSGGLGSTSPTSLYFNSFQAHENVYLTMRNHSFKFGFSVERMQFNTDSPNRNGGEFTFGSIADFLRNRPATFGALYPGSDTERGLRQTLYAGYLQDDYRLRTNLTLNFGLRYEFLTIPTEVNGKVALLHKLTDAANRVGGPVLDRNPTTRNFSPRVGVTWDPFNSGKTSIRAGAGIYDSLPLLWLYDTPLTRTAPFFVQGVSAAPPAGSFPSRAFPLLAADSLRTAYIDPEPKRAYSMKWNISIQHSIAGWLAEVGYTGSRGVHLPLVERNMNTVVPVETEQGWVYPTNGTVLNPNFGSINTSDTWNADSYYQGLQASIQKSFGRGLLTQGSYAWSKSIDTASSTGSTNAITGYAGAMAVASPLFPAMNRGLSDFDLRHNFSFSAVWSVPAPFSNRIVRGALAGWQIGSILRLQSGTPFSAALNNDRAGSKTDTTGAAIGQRPNLLQIEGCDKLTNPGNPVRYIRTTCFAFPAVGILGNLGRNTLTGPGVFNLDFSLYKNFQLTEHIGSQLRFELFNAFNHTNFSTPNIVVFDRQGAVPGSAGQITSTSTESRRIQVGLKANF